LPESAENLKRSSLHARPLREQGQWLQRHGWCRQHSRWRILDHQISQFLSTVPKQYLLGKEDSYSRLDFILLSRSLSNEWDPNGTYVLALPNWGLASDHRPIIARFVTD
jgi:hypothetical protein